MTIRHIQEMFMFEIISSAISKVYSNLAERIKVDEEIQLQLSCWKTLWVGLNGDISQGKFSIENLFSFYSLEKSTEADIYTLIFCLESYYALNVNAARPKKTKEDFLGVYSWIHSIDNLPMLDLDINKDDIGSIDLVFKDFFEALFPQDLRHRTGSFYTPVVFAEFLVDELFKKNNFSLDKKVIEPNCGSGSFLIAVYRHIRKKYNSTPNYEVLDFLQKNIVCLDKNPLSVLTTKVVKEWLIFDLDENLLEHSSCLNVFFADCINEAYYFNEFNKASLLRNNIDFSIAEKTVNMDIGDVALIINRDIFRNIENSVEIDKDILKSGYPVYSFLKQTYLVNEDVYRLYKEYILTTYSLKYKGYFDFAIGNPPWINWENLDRVYRVRTDFIWQHLGLFSYKGPKMAFSKEDYSTLVTYVVADYYLKNSGSLGFILPQSLFQSYSNSKGFRGFKLLNNNTNLKVHRVLDFDKSKIFKGVSIRTSYLILEKGKENSYPINYIKYDIKITKSNTLNIATQEDYLAEPSKVSDISSNWRVFNSNTRSCDEINGKSYYRARTGVFTGGANAVYYQKLESFSNGLFTSSNVTERAKRIFPKRQVFLEEDLVYPFLRGRDVNEWFVDYSPTRAIIIPHTIETKIAPIAENIFKGKYPKAYEYFNDAKVFLSGRGGLTAMDKSSADVGFYTVLRVGEYTFSEYKVVWRYIHKYFTCAVIQPTELINKKTKPCITQEKLMTIACNSIDEAFYLCGYLSSKQVKNFVESKMVSTQISAHVIKDLHLPAFDSSNPIHKKISLLCKEGHDLKMSEPKVCIESIRNRISELVQSLLTKE